MFVPETGIQTFKCVQGTSSALFPLPCGGRAMAATFFHGARENHLL